MKVIAAVLVVFAGLAFSSRAQAGGHPTLHLGDRGSAVTEVQHILVDYGYVLDIDARFGPRTDRAVRHFQKANGLEVDGIVGPQTWASLTRPSVRARRQQPGPQPASATAGAAPASGLDGCEEMSWYRQQAGLPDIFDAIGYRESRCRNDVTSSIGCCFGWLQLYLTSHLRSPGYRDGVAACGVDSVDDIRGNDDRAKRGQMCVAKVLYDVSGMSPWSLG